ncbi:hypothetical protein E4U55_003427 [Claviceps digitariae]|nr:hypothetical protein E4U55_003427 [Claviceps digitariae]
MATLQVLKRKRAGDISQFDETNEKIKRTKTVMNHWDILPFIMLTRSALRELDRRRQFVPIRHPRAQEKYLDDILECAKHGGPNLCHLRGYPEGGGAVNTMTSSMASNLQLTSGGLPLESSLPTSALKSKKTTAYDANFELLLANNRIFMSGRQKPENMEVLRSKLASDRSSLSATLSVEELFASFTKAFKRSRSESRVMSTVIPIITGPSDIPNEQNVRFTQFRPIVHDLVSKPQPDFFDGVDILDLEEDIRDKPNLYPFLVPTQYLEAPIVPSFFLEVKGKVGCSSVVERQACYDGAVGTRAVHTLQNYGLPEPLWDENAYTFSATYHCGYLTLYAHHITAPTEKSSWRPNYHMTRLAGYDLKDREFFVKGVSAFRNIRELAHEYRNRLVEAANARASQLAELTRYRPLVAAPIVQADPVRRIALPVSAAETCHSAAVPATVPSTALRRRARRHVRRARRRGDAVATSIAQPGRHETNSSPSRNRYMRGLRPVLGLLLLLGALKPWTGKLPSPP